MTREPKNPGVPPLELDNWIIEDLAKSGLTLDNFAIEPLRSEEELRGRLGFTQISNIPIMSVGGYWIPYPNVSEYYRLKLREKIGDAKYLSPSGKGNHTYILPLVAEIAKNYSPDKPIFITEGEKKACKATRMGFPCIGLSGVWNFKDSETDFLPELDQYVWTDRTVYIVFDSDISQKHNVKHAELRLAVELINRGARVYSVRLLNEFNGDKNGFDDYLARHGAEAFRDLVKKAKPTLEIHIEGDLSADRIVEEIIKLKSEVEKDKWLRVLSKDRNISYRALCKQVKRYEPKEEDTGKERKYTAYFPNLVDLVEDEGGNVVFLVKQGNELLIKSSVVIDEDIFYPPPCEQLPFKLLPRAEEVLRHYENDSDSAILADLISFHKVVSELPQEELYLLIATWVLHTYLFEVFEYSPYIWLFAIPERGKSRTGKGAIYIAYSGVHVESLRDAYLIRIANNLKTTIFFDVMDLWKKAEKAGSEDFLLQRFERGAFIARVLYPDRGAHQDTKYFNIFGATIVATNESVHPALESRSVTITMKEASREFGEIPLDLARSLKERLVALRARHLGENLPEADKPAKGRLGDILKPLMQIILLVDPGRKADFEKLIGELDRERKVQKSDSSDARLVSTVADIENQAENGLLSIQSILTRYNEGIDDRYKTSSRSLGWKLKALGFAKRRQGKGQYIELDPKLLERLMVKFGLKEEDKEEKIIIPTEAPSEKLHDLHKLHSTNNDRRSNDVVSSVVSQENQKTTSKLHSQNPYKYSASVNDVVSVVSPNSIKEKNNSPDPKDELDFSRSKPQSDYEIQEIRYSDGDIVYQLERRDEDGKPLIRIVTPDSPDFEDVRREYEQRSR